MRVMDSTFRFLNYISFGFRVLNKRNPVYFSRDRVSALCFTSPFSSLSGSTDILDVRGSYPLPTWNTVLAEGKQILEEKYGFQQTENSFSLLLPTENIIRRLQSSEDSSTHLISTFKNIICDFGGCEHWPGTVTLLLAKAIGNPLVRSNYSTNQESECDATWKSQVTVAHVLNLLQGSIAFHKECERLQSLKTGKKRVKQREFNRLTNHYFTSTALYKVGSINNNKAIWLISSILESMAEFGSQKSDSVVNCNLLRTLRDWEYSALHPQGILLANGFQAALELEGHGKTVQQMVLVLARYLVLAIKAHSDIRHFLQYQKSEISYFKLNTLPVVLHLEKNPELLTYIYSCGDILDNLDHFVIYSAVNSGPSLTEANKMLKSYIQAAVQILKEFSCSPENKNLIKLTESLQNVHFNS